MLTVYSMTGGRPVKETVVQDRNNRVSFVATDDESHLRTGNGPSYLGSAFKPSAAEIAANDYQAAQATQAEAFAQTQAEIARMARERTAQLNNDRQAALLKLAQASPVQLTESELAAFLAR